MIKKITFVSILLFWVAVFAVLTAGLVFYQNGKAKIENTAPSSNTGSGSENSTISLTFEIISRHSSPSDCWLIINNKVYEVSTYLNEHPGNASTITPYCGKEATKAFDTKGGSGSHSNYANSLLANYFVGDLNQTISSSQQVPIPSVSNSLVQPQRSDNNDEDDD